MRSFQPHVRREYALVADGQRGALIGPDGEIGWLCAPRWDSSAVFSGLLGGKGRYAVSPADPWNVWGGYYETGSLIWRSRWTGNSAHTECREALALPADPHRVVILRRIEAIDGPARMDVLLDVRAGFGRSKMTDLSRGDGRWTGRSGAIRFRWSGAARARRTADGLALALSLPAGGHHDLVLELSDRPLDGTAPDPARAWAATEESWSSVVPRCDDLTAARDARHAYAVLAGLTAHSGAILLLANQWSDIKRYLRIKQLCMGRGHPENVPAEGRKAYPQRPGDGTTDGRGDFASASRGGPAPAG